MTHPATTMEREPGLDITGRPSLGVGPTHTVIRRVPEDGSAPEQWISAGPQGGRLVSGVGRDIEGNDVRTSDAPGNNFTLGKITPPAGTSDAEYYERLTGCDAAYQDRLDYDTFPEHMDSYNSNSYVRGLLDATGGGYDVNFDDLVGGASPVPPDYFDPYGPYFGFAPSPIPASPPYFIRRF